MNGQKDAPREMFWGGIVAPAALLALVAFNLTSHRVYWPTRYGHGVVYTTFWPMLGIILMKLGMAGALFCWYLLSNFDRMERYAPILTQLCAAVAMAGLAILVAWQYPESLQH